MFHAVEIFRVTDDFLAFASTEERYWSGRSFEEEAIVFGPLTMMQPNPSMQDDRLRMG